MALVSRAMRPLRRELNNCVKAKPSILVKFETAEERNAHMDQLQAYLESLSLKKASFEKLQLRYLEVGWESEADQKAAGQQSEEDAEMLAAVDTAMAEVSSAVKRLSRQHDEEREASQSVAAAQKQPVTRLPKIAFPTFDGEVMKWKSFWDRFRVTVDENQSLTDVDKMTFLMGQLQGEAATTISGLAITEANYKVAVGMLKERYGNEEFIIDAHYTTLAEIPVAGRAKDLRPVVDQLEQHLNALKALGEDVNHRQFFTLIRSKLPPPVLMQMERERKEDEQDWDVDTLRERLRMYLQSYETAYNRQEKPSQGKSSSTVPSQSSGQASTMPKRGRGHPPSTVSTLLTSHGPQKASTRQNKQTSSPRQHQPSHPSSACPYCEQTGHFADNCTRIVGGSARKQKLKEKRLCFNCLGTGHSIQQCARTRPCFTCKRIKHHHSSICPVKYPEAVPAMTLAAASQPKPATGASAQGAESTEHHLLASNEVSLLQTITATFISPDGKAQITARGVFDNGSQRSYITEALADKLKARTVASGKLSICTFAVSRPTEISTRETEVSILLRHGGFHSLIVNVIPTITGNIQSAPIDSAQFHDLFKSLPLADKFPVKSESIEISFLIGADYMWDLLTGEKISLSNGLHLINSSLGWLVGGRQTDVRAQPANQAMLSTSALVANSLHPLEFMPALERPRDSRSLDLSFMWDLETLGIHDKPEDPGDEAAIRKFNETVDYQDNRYLVTWPWREGEIELPSNYHMALGRLNSLIRKYKSEPGIFKQYQQVINDQLAKGVIEKVDDSTPSVFRQHYIPHHAVINPGRTTKLRVVYDASAKMNNDMKSLNDCLYRGPVILDEVVAILIRFRLNHIGIASDIEKAFLQVGLQESERDVTRFLWLKDPDKLSTEGNVQIFRFARVPFGITSSPFLLGATIQYHLLQDGGETAMNILKNIYVDNILTGVDSTQQALSFYTETKKLFQRASMNVREWITNSDDLLQFIPSHDHANGGSKILGIPWDTNSDKFSLVIPKPFEFEKPVTKRSILKFIASFFDPLGLLSPAILQGKLFLQELWKENLAWDSSLQSQMVTQWKAITSDLQSLHGFTISRFVGNGRSYQLHCFCDASQVAYGACIYLLIHDGGTVQSHLIFAKTRLAPARNTMTIPRLELMAVHVGSKCLQFISNSLPFKVEAQFIWTDSQCVLYWLASDKPLTTFVRNRIGKIKSVSNVSFRYVDTNQNPADYASRSLPADILVHSNLWWNGPKFLESTPDQWPSFAIDQKAGHGEHSIDVQIRSEECQINKTLLVPDPTPQEGVGAIIDRKRFSSLMKLLRVTVWCLRALSTSKPKLKEILAEELVQARWLWLQYIQHECFNEIFEAIRGKSKHPLIHELSIWVDEHGLLRCGGRLQNSQLNEYAIHPILLPKHDHFTTLIIRSYHQKLFHAGVSHTLATIRNTYWIPAGRAMVFKVIRSCTACKKYDGGPYQAPPMPALPASRVNQNTPFTIVGLDYMGPLFIKEPSHPSTVAKAWVALFTCLTTRAIHLELVPDMTAEQFLLCLQRFCSRRGTPSTVFSDNASQFKMVKGTLDTLWSKALNDPQVRGYVATHGIEWKFITERAPWMGGFYERLVRSVKQCLRKSLGPIRLTFIQLETVLTEIEAVINTRPLIYVGSDFESGYSLTPAHFLSGRPLPTLPSLPKENSDPDYIAKLSSKDTLLALWKKGQNHLTQFWNSWKSDYLLSLREHHQKSLKAPRIQSSNPPKVGDIVHIQEPGPRGTWKLGQVHQLVPSTDGKIRTLKIRLAAGKILTRSVLHVFPMELSSNDSASDQLNIPSRPVPVVTPSAPRPQRMAAQAAWVRIKGQMSAPDSDHDSEPEGTQSHGEGGLVAFLAPPRKSSAQAGRHTMHYSLIFLLLCYWFPGGAALKPLLCQSHEAKLVLDLSLTTTCPKDTSHGITAISHGIIQVFKRNIAQYESPAFSCKKIKTVKQAWTNFAKAGWDHSAKDIEVPVSQQECKNMIDTHRCQEGPLLGSESIAYTDNRIEYPYTSGNAWDCCTWYTNEITNCFLTKGKVYATFGQVMESNLGNTANCEYIKGTCSLPNGAMLIWDKVNDAQCEFIPWRNFSGKYWNGRFLSDDQEIALTWNKDVSPEVELCDRKKGIMTDQGVVITHSFHTFRTKRDSPSNPQDPTDLGPVRMQAFEERLQEIFVHSLNTAFNQVCRSLQKMQQLDLVLAHSEPTLIARHLLNDTQIMARLNGKLLEVWPCTPVEFYTVAPMNPPACTEWIPLNVTAKGESISGYLDPKTNIVYSHSAPADCNLVEEMQLHDEDGNSLLYSGRQGTIRPFHGTVIHQPLYHDNLTIVLKFKEVIHKPLTMYHLRELRAHASLNDLYDSMDKTKQILDKLSDLTDSKPPNDQASQIAENLSRYTPWGLVSNFLSKFRQIWIYLCCGWVTLQFIWSWIISKFRPYLRKLIRRSAVDQVQELQVRPEVVASSHGPVERFVADTPL